MGGDYYRPCGDAGRATVGASRNDRQCGYIKNSGAKPSIRTRTMTVLILLEFLYFAECEGGGGGTTRAQGMCVIELDTPCEGMGGCLEVAGSEPR